MQLLTNHIGYERLGPKHAVITGEFAPDQQVEVRNADDHRVVLQLPLTAGGQVAEWHTGHHAVVNFDSLETEGDYYLQMGAERSHTFRIAEGLLMQRTFSDLLHYFKSQRCTGRFEEADRNAPIFGSDKTVDVRGGWYDASGDVSKYLSHLSYANFLNPQQTPMVVWNMLEALHISDDMPAFTQARLLDEALFGCEFLKRLQASDGYFYMTVFDKWSKDITQREVCAYETQLGHKFDNYQAGFRQGGGMTIAALAKAAALENHPAYQTLYGSQPEPLNDYLTAAELGYWHLREHNLAYLDDGEENIIDEYCALVAAVELYRATQHERYLSESRQWAQRLSARQASDENQTHFWLANDTRPYYHAAEAGLPVIALMQYLQIETDEERCADIATIVTQALQFEINITREVHNPFGYPRQYTQAVDGDKQSQFFVPHNNESGYWWQGENARIASLAAMAYQAIDVVNNAELQTALREYGASCLNWVVGLNPYDMSMIDGHGHNNPDYLPELGFFNARGGVCNGITSGFENEADIAFKPAGQKDDMLQNWRWGEQWIPHGAWFLLAVAAQRKEFLRG
ncbi:glycoside hydrolase family 9 protein [Thaumasiovibrio subtropicus]|uniref:glycoside hydrolase family 9 protein n=1 Tax=Thaumasiovibrio subtropicus TaxID=1891207 RepID=UPI000B3582A7|nr:glycoside hydrolase family 9 protein [Thaumasiovibrio subtropicus]